MNDVEATAAILTEIATSGGLPYGREADSPCQAGIGLGGVAVIGFGRARLDVLREVVGVLHNLGETPAEYTVTRVYTGQVQPLRGGSWWVGQDAVGIPVTCVDVDYRE